MKRRRRNNVFRGTHHMRGSRSNGLTRAQLEELWRSKLMKAQREYSCAAASWRGAAEAQRQSQFPSPDGPFAVSKAAQAEAVARREFKSVLKNYMDLIVDGTPPPPE